MDLVKAALATQGGAMGATASGGNSSSSAGASGEDAAYLEAHPEARAALNDFVSALLLEKPEVCECVRVWMDGSIEFLLLYQITNTKSIPPTPPPQKNK